MRNKKGKFIKGHIVPKKMRIKISLSKKGQTPWMKGKKHTKESNEKNRLSHLGKKPNDALKKWRDDGGTPWNKGLYVRHSLKTEFKKGMRPWNKIGDGISDKYKKIRCSKEYIEWRNWVYKKNKWTCQHCGKKCQVNNIIAHHIYYFSEFPEIRFSVKNGIVLCRSCHFKLHQQNKNLDSIFYQTLKKPETYQWVVKNYI